MVQNKQAIKQPSKALTYRAYRLHGSHKKLDGRGPWLRRDPELLVENLKVKGDMEALGIAMRKWIETQTVFQNGLH